MLATVEENPADDKEDEEVLAAVGTFSWFITKKRKESRRGRRRSTSPSWGSTSWRWVLRDLANEGKQR